MEQLFEWLVEFAAMSLAASVFVWIGAKICGCDKNYGGYFTALFIAAAAMLAVEFVLYFFPGAASDAIGGGVISAVLALVALTILICLSYGTSIARGFGAAVIAVAAMGVFVFILHSAGFDLSFLRNADIRYHVFRAQFAGFDLSFLRNPERGLLIRVR